MNSKCGRARLMEGRERKAIVKNVSALVALGVHHTLKRRTDLRCRGGPEFAEVVGDFAGDGGAGVIGGCFAEGDQGGFDNAPEGLIGGTGFNEGARHLFLRFFGEPFLHEADVGIKRNLYERGRERAIGGVADFLKQVANVIRHQGVFNFEHKKLPLFLQDRVLERFHCLDVQILLTQAPQRTVIVEPPRFAARHPQLADQVINTWIFRNNPQIL